MLRIIEEAPSALGALARIPIAFRVTSIFEVAEARPALGYTLRERPVAEPYVKSYDAHPDDEPGRWSLRFDVTNWGVFAAWDDADRVGSIVVAWRTPGVHMLEDREDLGVVWDLRLAPEWRRKGIGTELFERAENWMSVRRCRLLKVETQNVNVPACRFYEAMGCSLGGVNRFAYPTLPDEIQLLWYKTLA